MPVKDEFNFIYNDLFDSIWRIIYNNHKELKNNIFDYAGDRALDKVVDEIIKVVFSHEKITEKGSNNANSQ